MCWCDPRKRTPNCGALACRPPDGWADRLKVKRQEPDPFIDDPALTILREKEGS